MKQIVSVLTFLFFVAVVSGEIIPQSPTPGFESDTFNSQALVSVSGYFPQWSRLGLQDDGSLNWITVTGCGFLTHSEVTCVFDFTFTSTYARIVDDGTIECELPVLDLSYFQTLPQYTRLDLFFEGDLPSYGVYVGQFRWGPELEEQALSATRGPSSGGPAIQILGQGFNDPVLSTLSFSVYFDGQLASSASVSDDNTISVVPPAVTELGVDALVSVLWAGELDDHGPIEIYLHSPVFFHYGPLFDSITPACAWVNSSRQMTINGVGFTDPLFVNTVTSPSSGASARSNVVLEVTLATAGTVWDDTDYHSDGSAPLTLQAFSTSVSDTAVVFNSPNFLQGVIDPSNTELGAFYNREATVAVLWRQTRRLTSEDEALSYVYGPIFEDLDEESWHYGGGDVVCLRGCGFLDENVEAAINGGFLNIVTSSLNLWNVTVEPTITDSSVCYPINRDVACGALSVSARLSANGFFQSSTLATGVLLEGSYFAGPQLDELTETTTLPVQGGSVTLSGTHFGYSATNNNQANSWSTLTFTTSSESGNSVNLLGTGITLLSTNSKDIEITSFSDDEIVLSWGIGTFGELFDLTLDFDSECSIDTEVYMGPSCDSSNWYYSTLSGGTSVSVTGEGFGPYDTAVKLCDHGSASNNPAAPAVGSITTFGSSFPKCWEQEASGEAVGTVEFYSETTTGATSVSFTTDGLFTEADAFRGSRNWGQIFDVVVMFNSAQDSTFTDAFPSIESRESWPVNWTSCTDFDGTRVTGTDDVTRCLSYAALHCGSLRFGPVVDSFTPCQGPVGPQDTFITPVTFSGSFFDDSWAEVPRAGNPHLVSFGDLFGQPITNPSASTMSTSTVWGGQSLSDERNSITLFFDTCNITQVPDLIIHWGPVFGCDSISVSYTDSTYPTTCGDFYGAIPTEADIEATDYIYIEADNAIEWGSDITCIIDGVETSSVDINTDTDAATVNITCAVPRRPFGTRAKVCLAFGSWSEQNYGLHADPNSEWTGNDYRAIDRLVCLEQLLVFSPLLVAVEDDYAGHTSGTSDGSAAETFVIGCYGCDNYWLTDFDPTYLVGAYSTDADYDSVSDGYGELTFDVPTYVAEFNTDVSIAIAWFVPVSEDTTEFYKIWAEQTYHYGPLCTGISEENVFLYGTDDGLIDGDPVTLDLEGFFFQDCYDEENLCNNNTLNGICFIPQPSDTAQYPFTLNGEGNRYCLHRAVEISMVGISGTDSYDNVEESSDTLDDAINSDTTLSVVLPERDDIDCATYTFTLFFPDALVTNSAQRTIECSEDVVLTYGPGRPVISGFYSYTTDADLLGLPTIYGWGGPRQTVSSDANDDDIVTVTYDDSDPYFEAGSAIVLRFGATGARLESSDFDGSSEFDVPTASWGSSVQLFTEYSDGTNFLCNEANRLFHYGSEILYSDTDDCATSFCTNDATPGQITITGRALGCCGFSNSNTINDAQEFQHRCALSAASGQTFWTSSNYLPTDVSICTSACDDLETVTCNAPGAQEAQAASFRLVGFGLLLGSATDINDGTLATSTVCPAADGNVCSLPTQFGPYNQFDNEALESVGNRMLACYGPKVTAGEHHVRLSGYAPRSSSDTEDADEIAVFPIEVYGECDVAQENTVDGVDGVYLLCDYSGDDGTETTYATDKWECPSRFMAKLCGATDDELVVTFVNLTSPVSGSTYSYTPSAYIVAGNENGNWYEERGPDVTSTVSYGPFVPEDGYEVASANEDSWQSYPFDNVLPVPVDPSSGGVYPSLTITINYADDWIAPTSSNTPNPSSPITMWGTEKAACLFGTLDNSNPTYLKGLGNNGDQNDVAVIGDLEWSAENELTIECEIPPGAFGAEGSVYVLLDPHTDEWTQFYNPDDSLYSESRAGDWAWTPYISSASKAWSAPEGLEPVTFYGYGFGDYLNVICQFGTELAVQGDIVSDSVVVCQSPPYATPGTSAVTLTFSMSSDSSYTDNGCGYYDDLAELNACTDLITASYSSYTFTGVVSHNPRHGPIQGNTTIYFQQEGFDFYDQIDCVFHLAAGDNTVQATPLADASGDYSCISPAVDAPQEVQISLIGHYSTFENSTVFSTNLGCVWFAYGTPIITSISPDSVEFGSDVTQLTIKGWYFNGGLSAGSYQCVWQHGPVPDSDLPLELGASPTFNTEVVYTTQASLVATTGTRDGLVFDTFDVVCPTPAEGFPQAGQYPFELVFSDLPTENTLTFAVTFQTVDLVSVEPNNLKDFNATTVLVVTGSGFAGGRQASDEHSNSYLCRVTLQSGFVAISPADFISDTEIQCYAPTANLTAEYNEFVRNNRNLCSGKRANVNCNPTFDFPLDVSIDGGYTWSSETLTLTYSHQKLCRSAAASLSPSLLSLLFVPFFFLVAYFF